MGICMCVNREVIGVYLTRYTSWKGIEISKSYPIWDNNYFANRRNGCV